MQEIIIRVVQSEDAATTDRAIRKVTVRLIPFIFLLHVIACLDWENFGYAAPGMNRDLGISMELFRVPPGHLLHRLPHL